MTPTVTIGIPFYNNEATLANAIQSVLNQTHTNYKLLIVNDGSTDGSISVAKSFDDSRIHIVDDGTNKGLAARLNQIAVLTETDFLFRMDADDVMHPDRIKTQLARLQEPDAPDLVSAAAWTIDRTNKVLGKYSMGAPIVESSEDIIRNRGDIIHPSVAGRTAWFRSNLYRSDLRRSEDWELWIRTFDHSRHVRLLVPLLYFRQSNVVSLHNYRIAKKEQRKLILQFGPSLIGKMATIRLWARAFMQQQVMALADFLGRSEVIMTNRYHEISREDLKSAQQNLDRAIKD